MIATHVRSRLAMSWTRLPLHTTGTPIQGGGEGGDAEGLEKMMAAMGGAEGMGGMGGMPGMGAGRTPEDHKREVEALKAVSKIPQSQSHCA